MLCFIDLGLLCDSLPSNFTPLFLSTFSPLLSGIFEDVLKQVPITVDSQALLVKLKNVGLGASTRL